MHSFKSFLQVHILARILVSSVFNVIATLLDSIISLFIFTLQDLSCIFQSGNMVVLVLSVIALVFFLVTGTVLCFGFRLRIILTAY